MKTKTEPQLQTTVAARLSGEDVACGDFVAVLNRIVELPSYLWNSCDALLPANELVRLKMIPSDAGVPLKVFAICLPFVYARTAGGKTETLDLREAEIVRLDRASAKRVWSQLRHDLRPNVLQSRRDIR